jgi:ribokinase
MSPATTQPPAGPEETGPPRSTPPAGVAVVGSANADLVIEVSRRPLAGETVLGGDLVTNAGGKGANQAVAAARLGAAVSFVGCVGDDDHGRLLRASLRAAGVDDTRLRTCPTPTGTAVVLVTPDGDNSIIVSPGANAALSLDDVRAAGDLLARVAVVVLQREVSPEVSAAAAEITVAAGGRVVLSPSPSGPMPARLLAIADPVVVNEQEARDLTGARSDDGEELATAILKTGVRSAVVTLGAAGAVVADPTGVTRVASPKVTAVDTTGAGDALTGALAYRLAAGDDLVSALQLAVRVAAISVTRPGAQPSYPTSA